MPETLVSAPAIEPVSLAEAKAHLRLEDDAEDALVEAAITAARLYVERATRRALIAQGWRVFLDAWPASRIVDIPIAPLIAVDAVTVYDEDGEATVMEAEAYQVDAVSVPGRLRLIGTAPAPGQALNGIAIDVTAGHGEAAEDVPAPLRQAILQLIAHWHENRSATTSDRTTVIAPLGVDALIAPYRVLAL